MGKYTSQTRQKEAPKVTGVHPIMKGLGCFMILIVPVISYGAAVLLVNSAVQRGWPLPPEWLGYPEFNPLLFRLSGLAYVLGFLQAQLNLTANLVFALGIAIVIAGIMAVLFGYMYRLFGPPQYGPMDAPPIRVKVKRYKR